MWHMHQPDYRDCNTGIYQQPWTYLHAIKDYVDMVMHLEANPKAHVIVNFTPILLEQIDDYASQIANYISDQAPIGDPLLSALANPTLTSEPDELKKIIYWCSRSNEQHVIHRFPVYERLLKISEKLEENPDSIEYINDQYVHDLIVWYHLCWLAENVRRTDIRIKRLLKKEHTYDLHDRHELLTVIGEHMSSIIPRYRNLAEAKQIELSTTPYAHPIVPLLVDLKCATDVMPDAPLPSHDSYPGGVERSRWHIEKSISVFKHYFGFAPVGCWPSEGAVSAATCNLLQAYDFKWVASGAGVFWNSVKSLEAAEQLHEEMSEHMPNQLANQDIMCFFRDDRLSDLIGFEYSSWHADDAVANLIHVLKDIAKHEDNNPERVVSIILDGENAWEHYPENGYYFLNALYKQLGDHPDIELTTYSAIQNNKNIKTQILPTLKAGSWVYGTLSTWIGSKDKNKAWDMLCDAKLCYDEVKKSGELTTTQLNEATMQLAICEGSDWFWWFGDYNSADSVSDFEKLYRDNLINLYELLHQPAPDYLSSKFTFGQGNPEGGGSMRRSG